MYVQAGAGLKPSTSCSCNKEAENTVLSSTSDIHKQAVSKSHVYHIMPEEQQAVLHDFLHCIDQGTFGIPCEAKIYRSSSGMDPVAWPLEKSAFLPRILAQ